MTTNCLDCVHWMSRDDINGVCTLVNVSIPGDATCEYAEEGDDDD